MLLSYPSFDGAEPWDEMVAAYGALLMEGLSVLGTRRIQSGWI